MLENSAGMVKRAQMRIEKHLPEALAHVTFWQGDALSATFLQQSYDAVVTHFFLDVFDEKQLPVLVAELNACLGPGGLWLLSDFAPPSAVRAGGQRLLSRLLLPLMYGFFRAATGLSTNSLTPPQPFMKACGLEQVRDKRFRGGLVYTELWQKPEEHRAPTNGH